MRETEEKITEAIAALLTQITLNENIIIKVTFEVQVTQIPKLKKD